MLNKNVRDFPTRKVSFFMPKKQKGMKNGMRVQSIGELRKAIENLSDGTPLIIVSTDGYDFDMEVRKQLEDNSCVLEIIF